MLIAALELPTSGGAAAAARPQRARRRSLRGRDVIEPDVGAVAIVALIAAFFIVIGVMHVGFALDLRGIAADVRGRLPRPATGQPVAHG